MTIFQKDILCDEAGDYAVPNVHCLIIIMKAQGVPQLNNVAHPKHPEEEETSPIHLRQ